MDSADCSGLYNVPLTTKGHGMPWLRNPPLSLSLFTRSTLENLCEELADRLTERHRDRITDLTRKLDPVAHP